MKQIRDSKAEVDEVMQKAQTIGATIVKPA